MPLKKIEFFFANPHTVYVHTEAGTDRPDAGECTGANSTLNKGATGLPLRASAVVGYRGGGERGEGKGDREEKKEATEKKKGKLFGEEEHTAL